MLWILGMTGCVPVDCTAYDPGGGLYRCDQVWLCEERNRPRFFYESIDGELYDCQVEDQECTRMLCDVCTLGADVRELLCDE